MHDQPEGIGGSGVSVSATSSANHLAAASAADRRNPLPIVGLMGRKRSGKDTVARVVFGEYTRRAFADQLKVEVENAPPHPLPSGKTLRDHLSAGGWEKAKDDPLDGTAIRLLLQKVGATRRAADPEYWVRPVFEPPLPRLLIVTDVRLPAEVAAVRERGGILIAVENPALSEVEDRSDADVTEQAWRGVEADFVLVNPGTIDGLNRRGAQLRKQIGDTPVPGFD